MEKDIQELIAFLDNRPGLSKSSICREAGISHAWLNQIIKGQSTLSEDVKGKLWPVLNKYGGNFKI